MWYIPTRFKTRRARLSENISFHYTLLLLPVRAAQIYVHSGRPGDVDAAPLTRGKHLYLHGLEMQTNCTAWIIIILTREFTKTHRYDAMRVPLQRLSANIYFRIRNAMWKFPVRVIRVSCRNTINTLFLKVPSFGRGKI